MLEATLLARSVMSDCGSSDFFSIHAPLISSRLFSSPVTTLDLSGSCFSEPPSLGGLNKPSPY